jgi:hypothetical protein
MWLRHAAERGERPVGDVARQCTTGNGSGTGAMALARGIGHISGGTRQARSVQAARSQRPSNSGSYSGSISSDEFAVGSDLISDCSRAAAPATGPVNLPCWNSL